MDKKTLFLILTATIGGLVFLLWPICAPKEYTGGKEACILIPRLDVYWLELTKKAPPITSFFGTWASYCKTLDELECQKNLLCKKVYLPKARDCAPDGTCRDILPITYQGCFLRLWFGGLN